MESTKNNCLTIVYTGSYIDSLFISHYLTRAGINSVSRNTIKGSDRFISHNIFPGTSILVSKINKKSAESLIKEYHKELYS